MADNTEKSARNKSIYKDRIENGLTYSAIAGAYGISINRARVLVQRQMLREATSKIGVSYGE